MLHEPETLMAGFWSEAITHGLTQGFNPIEHELQPAPHDPHGLPSDQCAVYVFSLSEGYGSECPAGSSRVLKVGRVGPRSSARFLSQHYNPKSSNSNLARSLISNPLLWRHLGITSIDERGVGAWIRQHTDRDHYYLPAGKADLLPDLERFIRGIVGPVFEG